MALLVLSAADVRAALGFADCVQAMREADGNVKLATVMAKKRIGAGEARLLLASKSLREVLET